MEVRSLESVLQLEEQFNGSVDVSGNQSEVTRHGGPDEDSNSNDCRNGRGTKTHCKAIQKEMKAA